MTDEVWISGRRLEKALAAGGEFALSPLKQVAGFFSSGKIRVKCRGGIIREPSPAGLSGMITVPVESVDNFEFPVVSWMYQEGTLKGNLDNFEGWFAYTALFPEDGSRFLKRESIVLFKASGVTYERTGVIEAFDLDANAQAIIDGAPASAGALASSKKKIPHSKRGPDPDRERYDQFAAALAYVANTTGLDVLKSKSAIYKQAADFLATKGYSAMDEKMFRNMLNLAVLWMEDSA